MSPAGWVLIPLSLCKGVNGTTAYLLLIAASDASEDHFRSLGILPGTLGGYVAITKLKIYTKEK